ncbi:MAG: preprotein translocase subunit YajC [Planctomycetota bacterium]
MTTDMNHFGLLFAQDGAGGAEPGSFTAGTSADGGAGAGATGGGRPPGGGSSVFVMIFAFVVMLLIFSMFGQRREKKRREAMLSSIRKHDEVQTLGGVIGSVVEVKPDRIVLKVDESSNTRITFSRTSVQHVLNSRDKKSESETSNKN